MTYRKKKHLLTIRKIPNVLWDEIKLILRSEKLDKTVGRPVVPFRKVLDDILYVLRTGCQWKMLPEEYGSGSTTCHHRRFQEWTVSKVFQKLWVRLLEVYRFGKLFVRYEKKAENYLGLVQLACCIIVSRRINLG